MPPIADYKTILHEVLIAEDRLQARITELGQTISRDYEGRDLLLVCILRGGILFLTDLMRKISIPHAVDFMAVSSYGAGGRSSGGLVKIIMDLQTDIRGRPVLLVEDIVDTGHTISRVLDFLHIREPAQVDVCTLLDKHERREVQVPITYTGFQIPDKFVFGYGLDLDEYWRNLPFVAVAKTGV